MTEPATRRGLAAQYALWMAALVGTLLLASGALSLALAWRENIAHIDALQAEKARGAAARIELFMSGIEQQMGATMLPPVPHAVAPSAYAQHRVELVRLLRQVPAIAEAAWIDPRGFEQVRVSRLVPDRMGQAEARHDEPAVLLTTQGRIWRSAVGFRQGSEPYLTLARRGAGGGVTVGDVNLKFATEVVSALQLGPGGVGYVVDAQGRLIAHPDVRQVLRRSDLSALPQVARALALPGAGSDAARDGSGQALLAASARIEPLGWTVLVESPRALALRPLWASAWRQGTLLAAGLLLAVLASAWLARSLVRPIRALQEGAARIGAGELDHRIEVRARGELQQLAERFNAMAANLRSSYDTLEARVAARTQALAEANEAKSRFLAAASHDLRQPVHALGLFVGQLRGAHGEAQRRVLVQHIEAAVARFEALLAALLDISRLDAGSVPVRREAVALAPLLRALAAGFEAEAAERGLALRLRLPHRSAPWADSDPVLLERIVVNLVANALRYTERGGVLVGLQRRGAQIEIVVADTGIGIAPEQLPLVFREFHRVPGPVPAGEPGLGLGLAIVQRLALLLGHELRVVSVPGRGSRFSVLLPRAPPARRAPGLPLRASQPGELLAGRRVLVVDDEAAVREATRGQLAQWGLAVQVAGSAAQALRCCAEAAPELVITDLRLAQGEDGLALALALRPLPVIVVSGDAARLQAARDAGFTALDKPLRPAQLRALLEAMLAEPVR